MQSGITRFLPRPAALILVALALAIAVSYSILIGPFALAQEEGTVALSPAQPVVGAALTATLTDPDGTISATTWQRASSSDWDASTGTGTWSDISRAISASYTPVTGGEGKYLRATVSYTDGQGAGNSAQGVSANKVAPKKPTGLSAARGPGSGQVSLTHVAPGGGYNNPTGGTARVAAQATEIVLWSATLTVAKHSDNEWYGFGTDSSGTYGMIDPASFITGGTTYHIRELISSQAISGQALFIRILNSPGFRNVMTLTVGGRDFEGSAANTSSGNTGFSWLTNPAFTWAVGDTVAVSLKATIPDAPANVSAEAGDSEVALSWDDPSDDTITKYQYRQKEGSSGFGDWTDITGSGATITSHTVTSLTNGTAYSFQVRAAVATLPGVASGTVTATPAPEIELWSATLTVGQDNAKELGYSSELSFGSLLPTSFTHGGQRYISEFIILRDGSILYLYFSPDMPFKSAVTLIVDGERFPASAASDFTTSELLGWSNSGLTWADGDTVAVSLKATPPVAPANFRAVAGDSEVALSWDDPSDDTITKYQYRQKEGSGAFGNWTDINDSEATTTSHTVISLTNGTACSFQVRAAVATLAGAASGTVTATPSANRAPAFATETATLEVAENIAEGDDVGGAVTATDEDNDTLTYSLSGTDAASFAISGSTGQITVGTGASLDYESKASYTVTVTATDTSDATDTIAVTINVTNVDEAGSVALAPAQPVVGTALTATLADPDGSISATWVWAGSTDGLTGWTDISGATSGSYTPVAADVDSYLRATATYTDGEGTGKSAQAVSANIVRDVDDQVVSAPARPSGLAATAGLERVTLSWEDPGDSSITGYESTRQPSSPS